MARRKEFDPDRVLQRAMELFWERGYRATSMSDLVEHLGIGRASLYNAFGSKRELYLKALRRYLETRSPDPVELLSQPGAALPAVRMLVDAYVEEALGDARRRGCMVVNSAAELLPDDRAVARVVEASWDAIEVALTSALTRARARGELPDDEDPRALARFLLIFLQGVRVVAKGDPDPDRLRSAAERTLAFLNA